MNAENAKIPAKLQGKISGRMSDLVAQIWAARPSLDGNQTATIHAALEALFRESGLIPQLSSPQLSSTQSCSANQAATSHNQSQQGLLTNATITTSDNTGTSEDGTSGSSLGADDSTDPAFLTDIFGDPNDEF